MSDGFQPASIDADGARAPAMPIPRLDPESALVFVINASAARTTSTCQRAVIESLAAQGRRASAGLRPGRAGTRGHRGRSGGAGARHGGGRRGRRRQPRHGRPGSARGRLPDGRHPVRDLQLLRAHGIPTEPAAAR